MKAAVLKDIGNIAIEEREKPEITDKQVLIELKYVGICGSDIHYYEHGRIGDFVVREPLILGHECAGIVAEIGAGVENLHVGDAVVIEPGYGCNTCGYCKTGKYNLCDKMRFMATPPIDGAFTEYVAYPADMVYRLPDTVSLRDAALIEPLAIGVNAARTAGAAPGKNVAVLGAGCIGLVTLLACRAMGASDIYVTDVLENRIEKALQLGATRAIDARQCDITDTIMDMTAQQGVDIAIECSGTDIAVRQSAGIVKKGGTIVFVGMSAKEEVPMNLNKLIAKEVTCKTLFRYANLFPVTLSLVSSGAIPIDDIITEIVGFADIPEAFKKISENKGNNIKTVVKI